jgi:hypothetical protein
VLFWLLIIVRIHRSSYAFSQFAKGLSFSSELQRLVPWDTCTKCAKHSIAYMGYSIRSDRCEYQIVPSQIYILI